MRPDQLERVKELAERLADRFILEADPDNWPGSKEISEGATPADLSQQQRGDAYWCKKNAMATGGVLRFTMDILGKNQPGAPKSPEEEADLDRQVNEAQRRSKELVDEALRRAKAKPEFDKRTHGG